jgi:N-acyl-D-amino-acid deacylase
VLRASRRAHAPPESLDERCGDRGRLEPGVVADVVVFDPATIADTATFTEPHRYPRGIPWVLVNGEPVVASGQRTGSRPGRVLAH